MATISYLELVTLELRNPRLYGQGQVEVGTEGEMFLENALLYNFYFKGKYLHTFSHLIK